MSGASSYHRTAVLSAATVCASSPFQALPSLGEVDIVGIASPIDARSPPAIVKRVLGHNHRFCFLLRQFLPPLLVPFEKNTASETNPFKKTAEGGGLFRSQADLSLPTASANQF